MTYKIINTLTGDVTPCSALSMSRKLQPNTTLAEYGARGVLLNSYPISGVDLQCLSVHFGAAADADAYTYSVRRAADAAATAADAALAAAPDALATALAAAADAAYVHYSAVHAVYVKTHVSGEDAAYVLYSAAVDALLLANAHYAHYIKGVTRRSKADEYARQGKFILEYLRGV
jgi:hypothetical protein